MIKNEDGTDTKFLDASNRFFTLIPHDFGMKKPPILNNPDIVKNKIEMLDNLLEIEVAYSLLKDTGDENANKVLLKVKVNFTNFCNFFSISRIFVTFFQFHEFFL